jgi:hypothetical protein
MVDVPISADLTCTKTTADQYLMTGRDKRQPAGPQSKAKGMPRLIRTGAKRAGYSLAGWIIGLKTGQWSITRAVIPRCRRATGQKPSFDDTPFGQPPGELTLFTAITNFRWRADLHSGFLHAGPSFCFLQC